MSTTRKARSTERRVLLTLVVAAVGIAACWASSRASASEDRALRAVWTPKLVHFVYQGFTTHYSCDGLQEKVRGALIQLGARKEGLKVTEGACTSPSGGPEPFPSVDVKMQVLEPLAESGERDADKVVAAHWQRVDLKLDTDPLWEAGDCELLEQIKHTFLPLFTTRAVDY